MPTNSSSEENRIPSDESLTNEGVTEPKSTIAVDPTTSASPAEATAANGDTPSSPEAVSSIEETPLTPETPGGESVSSNDEAVTPEVAASTGEETPSAESTASAEDILLPEIILTDVEASETETFYKAPTRPVSWIYRILFGVAAIVLGVDNVTIKQLILPAQIAHIDPANKIIAFTLIASVGAIAGVISSPLIGALSDRTTWRLGRRRSWMLITTAGVAIGLVIMGLATSVWVVLIGEILVQFWVDGLLAVCTAIIPDQIPVKQRASASAFVGMSPLVGGAVGIILISRLTNVLVHADLGYYYLAITSVVFVLAFLLVFREQQLPRALVKPFRVSELFEDFWVDPRRYPDFGFVWLSRCLAFFGYQVLITYLLYYLQDVLKLPRADQGVAAFTLASSIAVIIAAVLSGTIADRIQRLKPFVIAGALLEALAVFIIAFTAFWPVFIIASILVGIGFGVYLAVDQAIAVKVLPRVEARGKDLGLINTAIFIPLIIGPLIGGFVLNVFHSYTILYSIAAVILILAAVFILPVKSVR